MNCLKNEVLDNETERYSEGDIIVLGVGSCGEDRSLRILDAIKSAAAGHG